MTYIWFGLFPDSTSISINIPALTGKFNETKYKTYEYILRDFQKHMKKLFPELSSYEFHIETHKSKTYYACVNGHVLTLYKFNPEIHKKYIPTRIIQCFVRNELVYEYILIKRGINIDYKLE